VRLGANVKDLIWRDGRVIGVRWSEQDGTAEATARAVIGADGYYSTVAKILNPIYETFSPVQRCIYYAYFQGLDSLEEPTAEHHFVGNTLTYIFPTDGNLTMVALSLPFEEFHSFKKNL
jgi:2-polyprenyl-6-methoxyphenol hydroxylase-like FAD-dependent oxidoreductase